MLILHEKSPDIRDFIGAPHHIVGRENSLIKRAQGIFRASRIAGKKSSHDPQLLEVLAEKQIPVELNVTSNIRTGCCPSFADHPVRSYFDSGLFVTLNSDDPPMFGSNLLDEYVLAHTEYEFTPDQLRELAANAAEASFLPPHQKIALLSRIEQYR